MEQLYIYPVKSLAPVELKQTRTKAKPLIVYDSCVFVFRFQFHSLRRDHGPPRVGTWLTDSLLSSTGGCDPLKIGTSTPWILVFLRKGKTAPAKKWPHMTLIEPVVRDNFLELSYPGMEALTIKLPEGKAFEAMERVKVAVWGDPCQGVDLGEEVLLI